MPELRFTGRARQDLLRLDAFLGDNDLPGTDETLALIVGALDVLRHHPFIGRAVRKHIRELVISRGKTGYVALYEYREAADEVVVLAIRHQREVDYQPD